MGTPTIFRFTAVTATIEDVIKDTEQLLLRNEFKPRGVARLAWSSDSAVIDFLEESISPINTMDEVRDLIARGYDGFAISYFVRSARVIVYIYYWNQGDKTGLALEVDSQAPYLQQDGMLQGEWLERFICEFADAAGISAGAYGPNWSEFLSPVEESWLVSELKAGHLSTRPYLHFYLFADELLSEQEVQSVLTTHPPQWPLRYFRSPYGQHVFSSVCPHCKGAWK